MVGSSNTQRLESLERWRAAAFLIGGGIFVVDAGLLAYHIASGTEPAAFGQMLIGASWTAAFIGLLGFYPGLAERSRWLSRVGGVFAIIGGITMAAMAVTMLGYATDVIGGDPGGTAVYFLPGVFFGIVLGFGSFGIAGLRTDSYSRYLGLLFLLLPVTFLFNLSSGIAGFSTLPIVLGVVSVLALTMLSIGLLVRTGKAAAERESATASAT
jgi:hypothetical protein